MVEVLCAGTRGECRKVSKASSRFRWLSTWDRLSQNKKKSGTRQIENGADLVPEHNKDYTYSIG